MDGIMKSMAFGYEKLVSRSWLVTDSNGSKTIFYQSNLHCGRCSYMVQTFGSWTEKQGKGLQKGFVVVVFYENS
jgi:hypothetical protein